MDLATCALDCPDSTGVYRLYKDGQLIHIGMAAGAATVRSEVLGHAQGEYGPATQLADRVEWEVAPDALFAYKRFLALHEAAGRALSAGEEDDAAPPTGSARHCSARRASG
jgi:hypothetical protein